MQALNWSFEVTLVWIGLVSAIGAPYVLHSYIYIHWSTCLCQCWFGVRKALSEVYSTVYYLSPSWQLGLEHAIVRVYDQGTPCIPCLYVEKVFVESRSINRARVDSRVARPDSRVSSAVYPRILRARGSDAAEVPQTFRYGVSFCRRWSFLLSFW
jgi:small basic protein